MRRLDRVSNDKDCSCFCGGDRQRLTCYPAAHHYGRLGNSWTVVTGVYRYFFVLRLCSGEVSFQHESWNFSEDGGITPRCSNHSED